MKYARYIIPLLALALFWFLPPPEGLSVDTMRYFGVFLAVALGLVLESMPGSVVGLIGICIAASAMLVPQAGGKAATLQSSLRWALSGFSSGVVWLMVVAFMFAMGYEKTGLGKRIALHLLKRLGKTALGIGYAIAFADLILGPFIPSSTARGGGTIFPIVSNIPPSYGSYPDQDPRKIGCYIMWIGICVTQISSSFFLTGLAPNLLALSIARDTVQVTITWQEWFMAMLPAGVALTMLTPLLTYYIYPPTEKNFPAVPGWAAAELEKMGPISQKEIIMASLAIFALGMWIFGTKLMDSTLVSLVVLALMLIFGVVTWEQVISNKQAWNMFCWFGTLITLAGGLAQTGFLKWFATHSTTLMVGLPPMGVAFGVLVLFYFTHYFFAGVTSHATAQIAIMLTIGMTIPGMDIKYFTMFLCGSLGIMGILTPYGAAHNTIYFGTGYIKSSTFWLLGAIFGVFNFAVYALFAVLWMPRVFG